MTEYSGVGLTYFSRDCQNYETFILVSQDPLSTLTEDILTIPW
jgi:hypothetical protein